MKDDPIVIVGAARTPIAGFGGGFADMTAPELGAAAISGALVDAGLAAADVEDVTMGLVLAAGQGQAQLARLRWAPEFLRKQGRRP